MTMTMTSLFTVKRTFLAVLFLGVFAMAARNVTDPDVWWHLKTGEYISQHKAVPHTDPFSYTRAGQPWVAHEWLTELGMYELQRHAGFAGLILTFAAAIAVAFLLLYLRCGPAPYVAGIATLCAAWATAPVWGVRPQVLSLLLTSLWLLILERSERNPHLLWWTLPLTLLWVNLHAGFALGLVLSGFFLAAELIQRPRNLPYLRTAAFVLLLDLLLVPVNPNGLRMFSYPLETLRSAAMQNYIAEWASPNFHHPEYWPFLLIIFSTFAALSWSPIPVRPRDLILLLVSFYASLASIRMIPLFVLIAIPLVAQRCGNWPHAHRHALRPSRAWLNAMIVLAMAIFASVRVDQISQRQPEAEARLFPAHAIAFLRQHPPAEPIFNHYDWGGYLIWKLYPVVPVFIDGRADLYGEPILHDFAGAYQFKAAWPQILQRWHIQTVIVPANSALATGLQNAPGWTIAYQDFQAVILTRTPDGQVGTATPSAGSGQALGCPVERSSTAFDFAATGSFWPCHHPPKLL
jgi:hypothetical protein